MKVRGKCQGMIAIARFNWPYYVVAGAVLVVSLAGWMVLRSFRLKLICGAAFGGMVYFLFASLGISHLIYDRSELYRWGWLDRALRGAKIRRAIFCHCGFDEASTELREKLSETHWQVLDHFDRSLMTEASIRRARAMFPPTSATLSSAYAAWPVASESSDVIFGLLAIHELRGEAERRMWFGEARRCLIKGGRVVLVEHVRDVANFVAFGPGFWHFHSRASWRRCWEFEGFRAIDQFSVTPFVQIFILKSA